MVHITTKESPCNPLVNTSYVGEIMERGRRRRRTNNNRRLWWRTTSSADCVAALLHRSIQISPPHRPGNRLVVVRRDDVHIFFPLRDSEILLQCFIYFVFFTVRLHTYIIYVHSRRHSSERWRGGRWAGDASADGRIPRGRERERASERESERASERARRDTAFRTYL